MLTLNFPTQHKSIPAQDDLSLPQFVVLIGVNGSGKTQFLEAISSKVVGAKISDKNSLNIQFLDVKQFLTRGDGRGKLSDINSVYENIRKHITTQTNLDNWNNLTPTQKRKRCQKGKDIDFLATISPIIIDRIGLNKDFYTVSAIKSAISATEIEAAENAGLFVNSLSRLIYNYFYLYDHNQYQHYLWGRGKDYEEFLDDDAFINKHGPPPWEVINHFLESTGLGLRIDKPRNRDDDYQVTISTHSGANVHFNDLSSGEQVLLQTAGAILKSDNRVSPPDIILLDEPDAAVHPSMAKLLIDALNDTFVRKHGAHMIVATHTPTTVAICDENAIFLMDNEKRRPVKIGREEALSNLLSGLPTVNLYVTDQKAVFVESDYDKEFYQKIFNAWKPAEVKKSLHFLSSRTSQKSGSCQVVYEMVEHLRKADVQNVFGLVDYDGINTRTEYVSICGEGERYSIEQFILDPLFIGILLVRDRHTNPIHLGFDREVEESDFREMNAEELQLVVDYYLEMLRENVYDFGSVGTLTKEYIDDNMHKINIYTNDKRNYFIERWYLAANGHDVEQLWIRAFPALNEYQKSQQNRLKRVTVERIIRRHTGLLSASLIKTFKTLLNKEM